MAEYLVASAAPRRGAGVGGFQLHDDRPFQRVAPAWPRTILLAMQDPAYPMLHAGMLRAAPASRDSSRASAESKTALPPPPEAPSDMGESPGKLPNPRRRAPRPIRSTSHWAPVHQLPRSDTRRRSGTCLMAVRASNLSP